MVLEANIKGLTATNLYIKWPIIILTPFYNSLTSVNHNPAHNTSVISGSNLDMDTKSLKVGSMLISTVIVQ